MLFSISETTAQPDRFFSVLPADWQEGIVPYWPQYEQTARIFVIELTGEVAGGGIVFSTVSPDTMTYREEAQKWADAGFLYIGFLWISEQYRGKKLGEAWLKEVLPKFPDRAFWLSIDDYTLLPFYERNGFQLIKKVSLKTYDEWILATAPRNL